MSYILSRAIFRRAPAATRSYGGGHGHKVTMNDLPVPQGDWKEAHSRANSKYNAILVTGIAVLASTIGFVKTSGVVHFNYYAPKSLD